MNFDFMRNTQKKLLGNHGGGGGGGAGGGFYSPFAGVVSAVPNGQNGPIVENGPLVQPTDFPVRPSQSPARTWWSNHILHTRGYLEAALAGNEPAAVDALKALWKAVLDWQNLTRSPEAGVLMAEHTALFKLAADSLAKGDSAGAEAAVAALAGNVESTGKLFPQDPAGFADLFGEHTRLAGAYALDLAEGNLEAFEADFSAALTNGDELQAFTDENF